MATHESHRIDETYSTTTKSDLVVEDSATLGPTVYVCNAVDCAPIGSGAVVCEIEELFAETGSCIKVKRSECIRGCGHGPVVQLSRTKDSDGVILGVVGFERCAEVAELAKDPKERMSLELQPVSYGFKAKMLRTRSSNMRWAALVTATKHGRTEIEAEKALNDAENAEYGAARAEDAAIGERCASAMDRAKRRWQRLREMASKSPPEPTESLGDEPSVIGKAKSNKAN